MYIAFLQAYAEGEWDISSIRLAISGGAALPEQVLHEFEEKFGPPILEGYGLSERCSISIPRCWRPRCSARPIPPWARRCARRWRCGRGCRPGMSAEKGDLIAFCKERVAAYKYPRRVWVLETLPKGPTGKILKLELKAQLVPAEA